MSASESARPPSKGGTAPALFGGCLGLLLLVFVPTVLLLMATPQMSRLAAPVLCPEGYLSSVVHAAHAGRRAAHGSLTPAIDCVLADGRTVQVRDVSVTLTCGALFFGLTMSSLIAAALAHNALDRWRRR